MNKWSKWTPVVAAVALVAGAGVAGAWRPAPSVPMAAPATIGTIKLSAILDQLNQAKDMRANLQADAQPILEELRLLEQDIQTLQTLIQSGELQGEALLDARQDLVEKREILQFRRSMAQRRFDGRNGDMLVELHKAVVEAAQRFAEANGYDLILLNDGGIQYADPMSPTDVQAEIVARRRVVYARANMDVTDQLIVQMNNAWAARGGAGGAPRP